MGNSSAPVSRSVTIYIDTQAAERAYESLEKRQKSLTEAINKGQGAGKDMTKELEQLGQVNGKMQELADKMSGKVRPSFNDVKRHVELLHRELKSMSEDAPGYAEKFDAFRGASQRLAEMREQLNVTRRELEKPVKEKGGMWDMLKGSALGTLAGNAAGAVVAQIGSVISSSISGSAKLSDELTAIEKAANLTTPQVQTLNSALGQIKTRTSTSDLRAIAVGLGQIGEAVTPENVANIDKIVVALGDEFGGGADVITKALGVLRNNLSDIKTANYGEDVLRLGNAMNVLGATGLASADVITDITTRISGIGSTMKLTTGQMLGYAATMQEVGIETERGSTGFTRILQAMTTNTAEFAKVARTADGAKMSFQEFARLVDTDMMGAFMAVARGSQEASKSNVAFGRLLKEIDADGSGASEVLAKMGANSEMLAKKINVANEALTNSSSITDEFNKRNNNLAGTLEKIEKRMASLWMSSGIPAAITAVAVAFGKFIGAVEESHEALDAFTAQAALVKKLDEETVPLISTYEQLSKKAKELGGESKLSKEEQANLKTAIEGVAKAIPASITQVDQYGRVLAVSTTRAKEFIEQQKNLLIFREKEAISENHDVIEKRKKAYTAMLAQEAGTTEAFKATERQLVQQFGKTSAEVALHLQKQEKRFADMAAQRKKLYGEVVDAVNVTRGILNQNPLDRTTGKRIETPVVSTAETVIKPETETPTYTDPKSDKTAAKEEKKQQREIEREKAKLDAILEKMQDFKAKISRVDEELEAAKISQDEQELQRVREKYDKLIAEAKEFEADSKAFVAHFGHEFVTAADLTAMEVDEILLTMGKQTAKHGEEVLSSVHGFLSDFEEKTKKAAEKRRERNKDFNQLRIDNALPGSRDEYEEKLQQLREFYDKKKGLAAGDAEMLAELNTRQMQQEAELQRGHLTAIVGRVTAYLEVGLQAFNMFNGAMAQQENNDLARVRAANDKKKKSLDDRLARGLISEGAYKDQVAKLDEQARKKEAEIKKKQFIRNQIASIIEATINTARSVAANLANPIMAAIIGALGAIQIGIIASQKVPEFEFGGRLKGKRHGQGGIPIYDRWNGGVMAVAEDGEVILSRTTVANNPNAVNALLDASMNGGGRRVNHQEMFPDMVPVNTRALARTVTASTAASGGRAMQRNEERDDSNDRLAAALEKFNGHLDRGIEANVVYSNFEKKQKEMELLKQHSKM